MKKVKEFVKKNKFYIVLALMLFFFMRSCQKSVRIGKSEKQDTTSSEVIDSLDIVIGLQKITIDSFPEILRQEKMDIHMEYDNWISSKDRGQQLMELHPIVKDNIKKLKK